MASDLLIPRWLTALAVLVAASVAGTVAALAGFWLLTVAEVGGDRLLVAWIVHPGVVGGAALGAGGLIGLATVSGLSRGTSLRRAGASAAVLLALGVAAVAIFLVAAGTAGRDFHPDRFRAAAAKDDYTTMETEARRAVSASALIGLSRAQLTRELGQPPRIGKRHRLYIWELGMINDDFGPGDAGALYVQFDPAWTQVRSARVATGFE
jgi:hypothetical protein